VVKAEYNFDGSLLVFYFTSEERIDFRELLRDLSKVFDTKVELRQIGARDEAKIFGGLGRCGRPICCVTFLTEFHPISIRMAKDQNLPLSPTEISGLCGRLLCCLAYEEEFYRKMKEKLPRIGEKVKTQHGSGKVRGVNALKETIEVELESEIIIEIPACEVRR
jgi:cell fate regulator YaaT (PSP1 superfamily)